MKNLCALKVFTNGLAYETATDRTGKLLPKNGEEYQIVIIQDNPDIVSLTTEKRLVEQALEEYEKQIGYKIKVWHQLEYPYLPNTIDETIEYRDSDPYFTDNILAYQGFPNGSLRGKMVFNNKFPWLDGYNRTGAELRAFGIILPNMIDTRSYQTFNSRQTLKHEFGHALGLEHTTDDEDVLNAIYGENRIMLGNSSKSTINLKYGKASFIKRLKPDDYIKAAMTKPLNPRILRPL